MPGSDVTTAYYESPIGLIEIEGSEAGISALSFVEARSAQSKRRGKGPTPAPLADCRRQLDEYFRGDRKCFSVRLDLRGTEFQKRVWKKLCAVKFGQTTTYKALATAVGNPAAMRAVGGANHRNPVSIVVPCHRVVGCDGRLTGYGGGLWRKDWLLRHEGHDRILI